MSETAELVDVDPRFPVGRFQRPASVTAAHDRMKAIAAIAAMPAMLSAAVKGLDREQLDTPYREGGWTVRQLVHHIADSHMNAFLRIRLALTEDWPTISSYNEKAWAELQDSMTAPVGLVGGLAGGSACALGDAAGVADGRAVGARSEASGKRADDGGVCDRAVWVAFAAPRGAHYAAAGAAGLVTGTIAARRRRRKRLRAALR